MGPTPTNRCRCGWIWAIVLLALVARVAAIVYLSHASVNSFAENRAIALSMIQGQGFSQAEFRFFGPTSQKPPIYPMLLAGAYSVWGSDQQRAHFVMLGINAVVGAVSTLLMIKILRRATGRNDIALAGGLIFALWPTQIHAATYLQGLALSVMLLLGSIVAWQRARARPGAVFFVIAGLLLGLAALTESTLTIFALLFIGATLFVRPRGALWMLIGAAVVVAPWVNRNCIVQSRPTGITNAVAVDLWKGNHDRATGSEHLGMDPSGFGSKSYDALSAEQFAMLRGQPEPRRTALLQQWALDWIGAHPAAYLRLCLTRVAKTLWTDWHHPLSRKALNLGCRSVGLLALLLVFALRRGRAMLIPGLLAIALVLATAFTLASARNGVWIDLCEIPALAMLILPRRVAEVQDEMTVA